MPGKTAHPPTFLGDLIGDQFDWLTQGTLPELLLLAIVLTTVCYRVFSWPGHR